MPGSPTTPGWPSARAGALGHIAFHYTDSVGTRDHFSIAAQWLACTYPRRRFADILADACARLGADVGVVEVVHLGLRAKPEPQGKVRREHRHMLAGGASDLDEIALPQILSRDTRRESAPSPDQVKMARYQAATVWLSGVTTTSQRPSRFWIIFPAFSRRFNTASVRFGM